MITIQRKRGRERGRKKQKERGDEKHIENEWKMPYQSETHFTQPNIKDDKTKTKIKSSKVYTESTNSRIEKERDSKKFIFRVIRVQLVVQ